MKFTSTSVIALAAISGTDALPGVRKVPPRTPPQRLETLNRFAIEFIDANVTPLRGDKTTANGLTRAELNKRISMRQFEAMKKNFEKMRNNGSGLRRCSFFDPNVPNGGPRLESGNSKRAAIPWVARELCALGDLDQCLDSDTRHRRQADNNDADFDPFDAYENELQDARSTAAVRLADDPALALRQIRTGHQKWLLRYISECNGQKLYGVHTKRLRKMTDKIHRAMADAVKVYGPDGKTPLDWVSNKWTENNFFADDEAKPAKPPKNTESNSGN